MPKIEDLTAEEKLKLLNRVDKSLESTKKNYKGSMGLYKLLVGLLSLSACIAGAYAAETIVNKDKEADGSLIAMTAGLAGMAYALNKSTQNALLVEENKEILRILEPVMGDNQVEQIKRAVPEAQKIMDKNVMRMEGATGAMLVLYCADAIQKNLVAPVALGTWGVMGVFAETQFSKKVKATRRILDAQIADLKQVQTR